MLSILKLLNQNFLLHVNMDQGAVWFLEANVLPGLTETSLLPQAVTASGNSLGEVYYSLTPPPNSDLSLASDQLGLIQVWKPA